MFRSVPAPVAARADVGAESEKQATALLGGYLEIEDEDTEEIRRAVELCQRETRERIAAREREGRWG